MSETMQGRMWGRADLVIPASKGQQLGLFQGMGPGATLELPDGLPVPAAGGMLQGTLAMAERPPAETWQSVSVEGPYPRQDRDGDEVPYWSVAVIDDDGEPIGKPYEVSSYSGAVALGKRMARDRRLELVMDATPE